MSNMRLIDVDKLEESASKNASIFSGTITFSEICKLIDMQPTIDPVRHGRWLANPVEFYLYCSECNSRQESGLLTMYCPNCGAKMDGEE